MITRADLLKMLTYRRPAGTRTEHEFIERYLDTIPGIFADRFGNRILYQRPASKVLITCHTDTVHRVAGRQRISVRKGIAQLPPTSDSNCLGADDTAGIYAALRLIQAGVQATYIFHREEECGGRGSAWLASQDPEWFQSFDICLSLDRRGTTDVIIEQFGERCASDNFALSLARELNLGHAPAKGIFTDSANYTHLIPECSNLSIGYQNEHTRFETLDLAYLERVISRLIKVNWTALTIERDPFAVPEYTPGYPLLGTWRDDDPGKNWGDDWEFTDEDGIVYTM